MLSCIILLAIEVDACVQLVPRIQNRAVSRCTRARFVHYFTRDLSLMLADITHQAFIKGLLAILHNSRTVKYMQARVSRHVTQEARVTLTILKIQRFLGRYR